MSGVRRNEATNLFASLWGDDLQGWNHDQRVMAAEIYELYLATTSITESDLIKRVNSLATKNPEACAAERTSSNSRVVKLQLNHGLRAESTGPPNSSGTVGSKRISMAVRQRVTRLRDKITRNIQDFAHGLQEPDAFKINREHLGAPCQQFGSLHDCLAEIYDCQQLLYTKFEAHQDTDFKARIRDEAKVWSVEVKGWSVATLTKDVEPLLAKIQHALDCLDRNPTATEPAAMTEEQAASRLCMFRVHLGENNVKASKGARLTKYGRAVDLVGSRANVFHGLLGSQDRQFAIARMLTELDSQDVKKSYQTFTERFASGWTKSEWLEGVCMEYEEGLIKQEKMVSDALKRERQATTQPSVSLEQIQLAERQSRSSVPSCPAAKQSSKQQTNTRRRRTESSNPPPIPPTRTRATNRQSQNSLDALEDQYNDVRKETRGSTQGLIESTTPCTEDQRLSGKPDKLNVRLDLAGFKDTNTSRKVRWYPDDTRDMFLRRVGELFPGRLIQQISVSLRYGTSVIVQATGPEGQWEIVQGEWLERLEKPSKKLKEPSAEVHLVKLNE